MKAWVNVAQVKLQDLDWGLVFHTVCGEVCGEEYGVGYGVVCAWETAVECSYVVEQHEASPIAVQHNQRMPQHPLASHLQSSNKHKLAIAINVLF